MKQVQVKDHVAVILGVSYHAVSRIITVDNHSFNGYTHAAKYLQKNCGFGIIEAWDYLDILERKYIH